MLTIAITITDDQGEETVHQLPAKHEVCGSCHGHGTHLNPSIGEHAYSTEEFNEAFSEPEQQEAYFHRGGMYDVRCAECGGKNVVAVVDRGACDTEELQKVLKEYDRQARADAAHQRLVQSELDFGC